MFYVVFSSTHKYETTHFFHDHWSREFYHETNTQTFALDEGNRRKRALDEENLLRPR